MSIDGFVPWMPESHDDSGIENLSFSFGPEVALKYS